MNNVGTPGHALIFVQRTDRGTVPPRRRWDGRPARRIRRWMASLGPSRRRAVRLSTASPHRRCRFSLEIPLPSQPASNYGIRSGDACRLSLSSGWHFCVRLGLRGYLLRRGGRRDFKPHWRVASLRTMSEQTRGEPTTAPGSRSRGRYAPVSCRAIEVTVERLRVRDTGGGVMRLGAPQWTVVLSTATVLACGPQSPPPPCLRGATAVSRPPAADPAGCSRRERARPAGQVRRHAAGIAPLQCAPLRANGSLHPRHRRRSASDEWELDRSVPGRVCGFHRAEHHTPGR